MSGSDENHNGSWTDDYITEFVTDKDGKTTANTNGTVYDDGKTWGTNTRKNDDLFSDGRIETSPTLTRTSNETYTRVNHMLVDFEHQHDNETTIANNAVTQVDALEWGFNKVDRKSGKVNIDAYTSWIVGDVLLGNGTKYEHNKKYGDYDYSTTNASYEDNTTTTYTAGAGSKRTGTMKITSGTMQSGHALGGTELVDYRSEFTSGTERISRQLHSDVIFGESITENLSKFTQTMTLNADGTVDNTRHAEGTSGISHYSRDDGTASYSSTSGSITSGNGATYGGTDTYLIEASEGASYTNTLDMSSTTANGGSRWGSVSSGGSGAGVVTSDFLANSGFQVASQSTSITGPVKHNVEGGYQRILNGLTTYTFSRGWSRDFNKLTGTETVTRSDSGILDTDDGLVQTSNFHDVEESGDLTASNHDWKKLDFLRNTTDNNTRDLHRDYTSNATYTKTSAGVETTSGLYDENWNDQIDKNESIHEHLRTDHDVLINQYMPPPAPPGYPYYSSHQTEFLESE